MDELPGNKAERPEKSRRNLRETLLIADLAKEVGIPVLPGASWGVHYAENGQRRVEAIRGLLQGDRDPESVAFDLKPDALIFPESLVEEAGLNGTMAQVRSKAACLTNTDYHQLAAFISGFSGQDVDVGKILGLFDSLVEMRTHKRVMDAFGYTGRKQIEDALTHKGKEISERQATAGVSQLTDALQTAWLADQAHLLSPEQRNQVLEGLTPEQRQVFDALYPHFQEFTQRGDAEAYQEISSALHKLALEEWARPKSQEKSAEETLQEELEPFKDMVDNPGLPGDPGIPPDDNDEYHTPPPAEGTEKREAVPVFEIVPQGSNQPLIGYYASGHKSYYDRERRVWSKRKQLVSYDRTLDGLARHRIHGRLETGLKALPIPDGYGVDTPTFHCSGGSGRLLRDQNGCFYIEAQGSGSFSVEITTEQSAFLAPPIPEDIEPLFSGTLSSETEALVAGLTGSPLEQAIRIQGFIHQKHTYPGGGDLQTAQALQYKLREESTEGNYLQNLDSSPYLECYSANTLFVALARRAGIPARLVVGHHVTTPTDGKAVIDASTGHAWSEVWDGMAWRTVDATPASESSSSSRAEDTEEGGEDQEGGVSDEQLQEAKESLEKAAETISQMESAKQKLNQDIQNSSTFSELDEIQKEIESQELLDDMKEDLDQRLQAKEEQLKQDLRDSVEDMVEDGFADEQEREKVDDALENMDRKQLDAIREQLERENTLYREYERIRDEVLPLVDEWFSYFIERLPKDSDIEKDEDSLSRRGSLNRRSIMRPRNLIFGTARNPNTIRENVKPLFLASIVMDISGSMQGNKLESARKLLVFFAELFSRIKTEFGYLRFSIDVFSDSVKTVKDYDQEYDSPERYDYGRSSQTVKARLMNVMQAEGGTNMLDAVKGAAEALNEQVQSYDGYASAMYFIGDGGDTCGNAGRITQFLKDTESEKGFGQHMLSAILMGDESQRQVLSSIFGEENTNVAPAFEDLIEQSMLLFDEQITNYLADKRSEP